MNMQNKAGSVPSDKIICYQLFESHNTHSQQTHVEPTNVVGEIMGVGRDGLQLLLIKEQNGSICYTISQSGYQPFFCLALS